MSDSSEGIERIFNKTEFCQWLVSSNHAENESQAQNYFQELEANKQIICINRTGTIDQTTHWYAFTKWNSACFSEYDLIFFCDIFFRLNFIHIPVWDFFLYKLVNNFSFDQTKEVNRNDSAGEYSYQFFGIIKRRTISADILINNMNMNRWCRVFHWLNLGIKK